jgi:hypothetical protein
MLCAFPMIELYDNADALRIELRAYRIVYGFVSAVHYVALLTIGFYGVMRLCESTGFAWRGFLLTLLWGCVVFCLGGLINCGGGILHFLDYWHKSILRRQSLCAAAESLRNGEEIYMNYREVTLYEGVVVPKPGGRTLR